MTDPVEFFRERWVELHRRGVSLLEGRAAESERARRILDDVRAAEGAAWLAFEGTGEVWLRWREGRMDAVDARPSEAPVRLAVALPGAAAQIWVERALEVTDLDSEQAAVHTARSTSARLQGAMGDDSLAFHLIITDAPDLGEVVVRIGVHTEDPPATPRFTATVAWADLAAARERGDDMAKLFMAGKLKLGGDYSQALQVAMKLMQEEPL
jgi:hypothetical protein